MNLTQHFPGNICGPRFRSFLIPLLRTRLAQIRVLLLFLFRNASLIFASVLVVCTSFPQAQKKDTTIRVSTDVIAVNARVTDKHDREVPGLTAEDFSLFEDGKRQQINSLFPNSLEPRLWYRSLGAHDRATQLSSLRVTNNQYAISGSSRRERTALQAIASLPEKVHGRPGRLPPIPGSLETLLT